MRLKLSIFLISSLLSPRPVSETVISSYFPVVFEKIFTSDKSFSADKIYAKEMFDYACSKRASSALLDKVEKWNRWADRWEEVDLPTSDPSLN